MTLIEQGTLTSGADGCGHVARSSTERLRGPVTEDQISETEPCLELPVCICGMPRSKTSHDRIVLESPQALPRYTRLSDNVDLHCIPDAELALVMCTMRAEVSYHLNESQVLTVECLLPLCTILPCAQSRFPASPECVLVRDLGANNLRRQFTVLTVPFIRDCLLACGAETLAQACRRKAWAVPASELCCWFTSAYQSHLSSTWELLSGGKGGQQTLGGIHRALRMRNTIKVSATTTTLRPLLSFTRGKSTRLYLPLLVSTSKIISQSFSLPQRVGLCARGMVG